MQVVDVRPLGLTAGGEKAQREALRVTRRSTRSAGDDSFKTTAALPAARRTLEVRQLGVSWASGRARADAVMPRRDCGTATAAGWRTATSATRLRPAGALHAGGEVTSLESCFLHCTTGAESGPEGGGGDQRQQRIRRRYQGGHRRCSQARARTRATQARPLVR
eukprot:1109536-Prymnesium_polylepis.1